jgi:CDGSH-type Zn-finger protein
MHEKNKPFCDNSHEENGFRDRGAVGEPGSATATWVGR